MITKHDSTKYRVGRQVYIGYRRYISFKWGIAHPAVEFAPGETKENVLPRIKPIPPAPKHELYPIKLSLPPQYLKKKKTFYQINISDRNGAKGK